MSQPPPLDAVLVGAARTVPGDDWINERGAPLGWTGTTKEALWWAQALEKLHEELYAQGLTPGPVITRTIRVDEHARAVALVVETWARGVADAEWGLPWKVRGTLEGLADCPNGGDVLVMPA